MYSVTVKIDGIESRRRSAGLLHIVIGFFLIAKAADFYRFSGFANFFSIVPSLLVASLSLFYGFFRKKVDPFAHYNHGLRLVQIVSFTALVIMFFNISRTLDYIACFVFALLCLILLFSERRIFQETTVFFDESGIRIPGIYREHLIPWDVISNVVIREDFLTIFHVRQKYLQFQVMQDLSTLETAKMNAFCKEQIDKIVMKREDAG